MRIACWVPYMRMYHKRGNLLFLWAPLFRFFLSHVSHSLSKSDYEESIISVYSLLGTSLLTLIAGICIPSKKTKYHFLHVTCVVQLIGYISCISKQINLYIALLYMHAGFTYCGAEAAFARAS
jgi:hypothetical protein